MTGMDDWHGWLVWMTGMDDWHAWLAWMTGIDDWHGWLAWMAGMDDWHGWLACMTGMDDWHGWLAWMTGRDTWYKLILHVDQLQTDGQTDRRTLILVKLLSRLKNSNFTPIENVLVSPNHSPNRLVISRCVFHFLEDSHFRPLLSCTRPLARNCDGI